jgi:hypothetical protein
MTPWAYTDDMSVPFNVARLMLNDDDKDTALLTDAVVTSTLATFGWQKGMSVLAGKLVAFIQAEVTKSAESGGATYEWSDKRTTALEKIQNKGNQGTLPDPIAGAIDTDVYRSINLQNQPGW